MKFEEVYQRATRRHLDRAEAALILGLRRVVAPVLRCAHIAASGPRLAENHGKPSLCVFITAGWYYRLEPCVLSIRHQPNGFHSKISFGNTVSAAKRAMNIADAINTPK